MDDDGDYSESGRVLELSEEEAEILYHFYGDCDEEDVVKIVEKIGAFLGLNID